MTGDAQPERKPRRQTKFDAAERERLRRALLSYARENRIGAPNLQLHIAEKLGRTVDEVGALKTLQRFLTGEGRVNDGFVMVCAAFVERTGAMTAHDELAHDLGEFFARNEEDHPADEVPDRLAGDYEVWTDEKPLVGSKGRLHFAHCLLSGTGHGLKAHEQRFGVGSGISEGEFRPPVADGMMLYFAPLVFLLLKDRLTRLPRTYWLREMEDGSLAGHGIEGRPTFVEDSPAPYTTSLKFEFQRKDGETP